MIRGSGPGDKRGDVPSEVMGHTGREDRRLCLVLQGRFKWLSVSVSVERKQRREVASTLKFPLANQRVVSFAE